MVIRVGIALADTRAARLLADRVVACAVACADGGGDLEADIAFYGADTQGLLAAFGDLDIAFIGYDGLESALPRLEAFHAQNPHCLPVAVGTPQGDICRYLALRPGGHLSSPREGDKVAQLCQSCARAMAQSGQVLQFTTRQGSYALSPGSVLFCQSDQKYVSLTVKGGDVFRKLGKLDDLMALLPPDFLRVHQSFALNPAHAAGLDKTAWEVLLTDGSRIPVSRAYRKQTEAAIQKCLSGVQL